MNVVWFMKQNLCLQSAINNVMSDLLRGGLIDYVISEHVDAKYLNVVEKETRKQKLSLEQFSGDFFIQ